MALAGRLLRPLLLGAVSISLVLSGCSGGGGGAKPPATAATGTTATAPGVTSIPSPSGAAAPGPDDQRLQAIVVTAADLPTGWVGRPSPSTPSSEAATSLELAQCLGRRNLAVDLVASVTSQDFSQGPVTIASSARSYLSDDDVATATASYSNPKISSCYQQLMSAPGGAKGAAAQNLVVKVTPGSAGGPSNVVATATLSAAVASSAAATTTTLKKTGKPTKTQPRSTTTVKPIGLVGTIVFITGPRLTAEIDFFGLGQEVPAALRSAVIAKVAARAAKG